MTKCVYERDEILAEHDYAKPHVEAGYRLHGGFDADGDYVSPRTVNRWDAVKAWNDQLNGRGWELIDASQRLLSRGNYPTPEQTVVLLSEGIGKPLWDSLTVTGVIEARGRVLCEFTAPDFQDIIEDNISETATGHLNKGLLFAHGLDEGGDPASGIGAHDEMWFAVRDMVFGKDAYDMPEIPESISRPEGATREMPQIPEAYENTIKLLMNVLMIEVRAENFFSYCQSVMRDPRNFKDRRAEAELGAEIVGRIRTDEAIHVAYLQTFVSELRSFKFKTENGLIDGKDLIDPLWAKMVEWHTQTNWDLSKERSREAIRSLIESLPSGNKIWEEFENPDTKAA